MKKFTTLLLICLTINAFSQNSVYVTNTSSESNCDGSAQFSDSTNYTSWNWYNLNSNQILQQNGQTVENLCIGQYLLIANNGQFNDTIPFNVTYDSTLLCNGFYASINTSNSSGPNSCDASAYVNFVQNGTAPYSYTWSNGTVTDSISGLCNGTYTFFVNDANGCEYTQTFSIVSDSSNTNCNAFMLEILGTTNITNPNICDGTATFNIYGGSGYYQYYYENTQVNSPILNGLCEGFYVFTVNDTVLNCSASISFSIYGDSTNTPELSAYASPYPNYGDINGVCSGSVYINIYGGTSPYIIEHSDGQMGAYLNNLCTGVYSAIVTDNNGDSLIINYIIADSSTIYNGGGYPNDTIVDTLTTDILLNCLMDYTSIDSVYISAVTSNATLDSLFVTWIVIGTNGLNEIVSTYAMPNDLNAIYEFFVEVFCPQRGSMDFFVAYDRFDLSNMTTLGKSELTFEENISVYPNPFNNIVYIQSNVKINSISISNINGKLVHFEKTNSNVLVINGEILDKGVYFVNIDTDNGQFLKKIIK